MITVVFSTKNGESRLCRTLNSLCELNYTKQWQLIIVDNNSDDASGDIVRQYQERLPLLFLEEPRPGKNNALNTAIEAIKGDIVVFTDDDVRVEPDWLTRIDEQLEKHPDFDIFAGKIIPEWEEPPEPWILQWAPLGHLYAIKQQFADGPCSGGDVWGPNMVVRKTVLASPENRFDPDIGPNGTPNYPMGSETEFTNRMERQGYRCWQSTAFAVHHWIPSGSLSASWIFSRALRLGKGVTLAKYRGSHYQLPLKEKLYHLAYSAIPDAITSLTWNKKTFWLRYKAMYAKGVLTAESIAKKN